MKLFGLFLFVGHLGLNSTYSGFCWASLWCFLWKLNFKLSKFKGEGKSFRALQKYLVNYCAVEANFHLPIMCC